MASFNKIILCGYLGRDPELKYTPQGNAVCSFTIATSEKRKDKSGELQDQTTWFRVTAWNRLAEVAQQYLAKGSQVYIEGRLRVETYTDRDGQTRTSLEVMASDLQFIGARADNAGQSGSSAHTTTAQAATATNTRQTLREPAQQTLPDDDIPF